MVFIRSALFYLVFALFACFAQASEFTAEKPALTCSPQFPCPAHFQPRVQFWVDVFSTWRSDQVILHDANKPWRVYAVISDAEGCSTPHVRVQRSVLSAKLDALLDAVNLGDDVSGFSDLTSIIRPLTVDSVVQARSNLRCQIGVRDSFAGSLQRFGRYQTAVQSMIAETDLSSEFQYLPFVESGYNPLAGSKVGAKGMWQIMPATARDLGLRVNAIIDERYAVEASTRAAMRYFQKSRARLQKALTEKGIELDEAELNPFLVTSYNYGVNGVRRAIEQVGGDFYQVLEEYQSPAFRVAVKNFYASFLAATHIAKNRAYYFSEIELEPAQDYLAYRINEPSSLQRILDTFDVDKAILKELNPALGNAVWTHKRFIPENVALVLPNSSKHSEYILAFEQLPLQQESLMDIDYRVRSGDTACAIAIRHNLTCAELITANALGPGALIRKNQYLKLPNQPSGAAVTLATRKPSLKTPTPALVASVSKPASKPVVQKTEVRFYRVQAGDTACGIANRHNLRCAVLLAANQLSDHAFIRENQQLKLPNQPVVVTTTDDEVQQPSEKMVVAVDEKTKRTEQQRSNLKTAVTHYRVKAGDTLCGIANSHDVSCADLKTVNRLDSRALIRENQLLLMPSAGSAFVPVVAEVMPATETKAVSESKLRVTTLKRTSQANRYRVKAGDTACGIAVRHRMGCAQLLAINDLDKKTVLGLGQWLNVTKVAEPSMVSKIPVERRYRIKNGDTACAIAVRFGLTCQQLLKQNGLTRASVLKQGRFIRVNAEV